LFNGLALASVVGGLLAVWKKRDNTALFLLGILVLFFFWFLVIGSTYRFVVMVAPILALLISHFIIAHYSLHFTHYLSFVTLSLFLFFEFFYQS